MDDFGLRNSDFGFAAALVDRLRALAPGAGGMTADSRRVRPGDVFLAYPGGAHDGRSHIADAIRAGAAAILWEPAGWDFPRGSRLAGDAAAGAVDALIAGKPAPTPNLPVPGLKDHAAGLAAAWYANPSQQLWVTGITGTNGKTSVAHWLSAAWTALGRKTAAIGTIGNGFPGELEVASHTTPDAVSLQALLADYRDAGAGGVAMEVSSHGLHQGRVEGVAFDVAVLTNLTQDHLDYHGDMASYAAAKARLFAWPGLKWAVLNADDELGASLEKQLRGGATQARRSGLAHDSNRGIREQARSYGYDVLSYGLHGGDLRARILRADRNGLRIEIVSPWGMGELTSPLLGEFNAYNLLAALGALLAGDVPLADALAALAKVEAVPGRMQRVNGGEGEPTVIVDFAHTPDALEKVLAALKPLTKGKLVCVFGCGGGRDTTKRPLMGAVVAARADAAIVTSDNPRNEDPAHIIADILAGMPPGQDAIVDRRAAIHKAIHAAAPEDIVVLAGKGHEPYQESNGVRVPFSDREEAQKALSERKQRAST
ncbi:MAG: UDP-N-acetylmuramoyl-L-alanyl-D-glutamate--2,6-diaminopimelate ligase [Pseudomonadota bacterium]|nr:UDP-N-acetylmuramoyl-L-alanyl-D-glutamate--2,6-diaminopimelate ligase [Pseudomonadota bacterium]